MAYKFQLGDAKLGGSLEIAAGSSLSGSLTGTDVDDTTAANVVAEIDNAEIAAAKVAVSNNQILIGDGDGKGVSVAMQGDATIVANGTLTIGDDKVTYAKIQNVTNARMLGNNAGSDGNVTEMTQANVLTFLGVEAGATADQTAAEIRTLVGSATDSNVFTDADHTKLDGIEASATADQTAAEIRTLVESATDSNVFTDADHTKLNGIEASATADQTAVEIIGLLNSDLDGDFTIGNQPDDVAQFTGPILTAGGIVEFGEAQNGEMAVRPTAHGVAGKDLSISAGKTTAGTTNDIAGGKLVIQAGQGKGTGAGGAIEFNVATAAGSTGNALNAYANALTIAQDKNAQFKGNLTVDGDLLVSGATVTMDVANLAVEDNNITIRNGAAAADGSGITIGTSGTPVTLQMSDSAANLASSVPLKAPSFIGSGASLTALNGSNISSGTIAAARVATLNQDTTGTAAIATTVTVADESEDTSCNVLFTTAATGDLGPKSGTNLTFNSANGTLTATEFVGGGAGLTGLPAGNPPVNSKNGSVANPGATGGVALDLGVNVLSYTGSVEHNFRLPEGIAGDRVWIKAASNTSDTRSAKITGSLANNNLVTIDGASSISLVSPDAAVCLVNVGSNAWRVF